MAGWGGLYTALRNPNLAICTVVGDIDTSLLFLTESSIGCAGRWRPGLIDPPPGMIGFEH